VSDFPGYDDICDATFGFAARHAAAARAFEAGRSEAGRPVPALRLGPDDARTELLLACGRHGSELGTRRVGLALADWLVGDAGDVLQSTAVTILPVTNPDGCAREEFGAPDDGTSRLEEELLASLVLPDKVDAVVDVHSLHAGDMLAVIDAHAQEFTLDDLAHEELSRSMAASAAAEGFLFERHAAGGYNNFFCAPCYERAHAVVFGMETNHFLFGARGAAEAAVAALKAIFQASALAWQKEPLSLNAVCGDQGGFIRAVGATPAGLRRSRAELWKARAEMKVERAVPSRKERRLRFSLPAGAEAEACLRVAEGKVMRVKLDGETCAWTEFVPSPLRWVCVRASGGEHELVVDAD